MALGRGLELPQHRRVPGEHTEIAFGSRQLQLVELRGHERALRSDDLEGDLGGKSHGRYADCIPLAFSTASSIVPTT